jgi:hypothetical protein
MTDKLHLIFSTTAGDLEDDFPANQPLHATKRAVMGRLKLDPAKADEFVVTLGGNILDESKVLGALGLTSGSVLVIERRDVTKI